MCLSLEELVKFVIFRAIVLWHIATRDTSATGAPAKYAQQLQSREAHVPNAQLMAFASQLLAPLDTTGIELEIHVFPAQQYLLQEAFASNAALMGLARTPLAQKAISRGTTSVSCARKLW